MKKKIILLCLLFLFLSVGGTYMLSTKLTYLETAYLTFVQEDYITIDSKESILAEEITMPYDIVSALTVRITNFSNDSNSKWCLTLLDSTGSSVYTQEFQFIDATDNGLYTVDFGHRLRVHKNERYTIEIQPLKLSANTAIGFYRGTSLTSLGRDAALYIDREAEDGALCMCLQGGDYDFFWCGICLLFLAVCLIAGIRILFQQEKGVRWIDDTVTLSILTGLLVFLFCLPYAATLNGMTFTDENDNIRGGMILATGKVLYRDYVTQHTPVAYYLCSVFARIGASSVSEMRVLLYVCMGLLWAFLFHRHSRTFGKAPMFVLPFGILLVTSAVNGSYLTNVLGETLQAMAFVTILLEFLRYREDHELTFGRAVIVSLGAWLAFGSVFISLYAVFFLVLGFFVCEYQFWKAGENGVFSFKTCRKRYLALFVCAVIPGMLGIIYFKANHALGYAFDQMYRFNREVYTHYQTMGSSILEPFFSGVSSLFEQFTESVLAFGSSYDLKASHVLTILLVLLYVGYAIDRTVRKKQNPLFYLWLTFMICAGAARGVDDWHGQTFWALLVVILVVLVLPVAQFAESRIRVGAAAFCLCFLASVYLTQLHEMITDEQQTVSYLDPIILEQTEEGEDIFIDAYCDDSIYLLAKGRYPVNRAVYCLPWYMDWYEDWNLADLKNEQPRVVVWDPDESCWNVMHYAVELNAYINKHYERIDDGALVWIRKE